MTDFEKPLITFALITYNQENLVAEAIKGALSQTYSPLEIILSDDCSPDHTFEILQKAAADYRGPHTVTARQTGRNLGIIGHINSLMEVAQGELVVIAAGDDISLPQRVERLCEAYLASSKRAFSLFSNAIWIDENGNQMNLLYKKPFTPESLQLTSYAANPNPGYVNGSTHAWQKKVFQFFGPLPPEAGAEDITIPFRSALLGEIRYVDEPLILYRRDPSRFRTQEGQFNFAKYRQKWLGWTRQHAQMYKGRLNDLQILLQKGQPQNQAKIDEIRQFTLRKTAELDALLAVSQGERRDSIPYFQEMKPFASQFAYLKTRLAAAITPIWGLLNLELYFKYQDLRRLLRARSPKRESA